MQPAELSARVAVQRRLTGLGFVAGYGQLREVAGRRVIERMVADGSLLRLGRDRYAIGDPSSARLVAHRVGGVAAYRTAAAHWRWPVKWPAPRPCVVVPRGRRVPPEVRRQVDVAWRRLSPQDVVDGWVTGPLRTALDCAVALPFDEGLTVADSALRTGAVTSTQLLTAAAAVRGPGRARALRVARHADPRADGPLESVARAISLDVPGLWLTPQVRIEREGRFVARVDLADLRLRIVVELDSFEFHSSDRSMLERDCRRDAELVAGGWLVLRFSWEQVMRRPEWVREMLTAAVARRTQAA